MDNISNEHVSPHHSHEVDKRIDEMIHRRFPQLVQRLSSSSQKGTWEIDRAGIPYLLPRSKHPESLSSDTNNFFKVHLKQMVCNTLKEWGISFTRVSYQSYSLFEEGSTAIYEIIVIVADKPSDRVDPEWPRSPRPWINAACDIYEMLHTIALQPETLGLSSQPSDVLRTAISNLKVEIIALHLLERLHVRLLSPDEPFVKQWNDSVCDFISDILDRDIHLQKRWNCLKVLRCGERESGDFIHEQMITREYPITIFVTVDEGLQEADWISAQIVVEEHCERNNCSEIVVKFSRGSNDEATFRDHKRNIDWRYEHGPDLTSLDSYPSQVNMGADIGSAKDNILPWSSSPEVYVGDMSTLGGFIEVTFNPGIQKAGYKQKQVFGLTNYHSVRPLFDGFQITRRERYNEDNFAVPLSPLDKIDRCGHGPNFSQRQTCAFESPSRTKHDWTVALHQWLIQGDMEEASRLLDEPEDHSLLLNRVAEDGQKLKVKKNFFDQNKQEFARPFICSGYIKKTNNNARQDWALLEVQEYRIGSNLIPPSGDGNWSRHPESYLHVPGTRITKFRSAREALGRSTRSGRRSIFFMVGALTNCGCGALSPTRIKVAPSSRMQDLGVPKEEKTEELAIFSYSSTQKSRHCHHGDSGAWVFDCFGELVGMLWGESRDEVLERRTDGRLLYFTDVEDLFAAIKQTIAESGKQRISPEDVNVRVYDG